MNHSKMAYILGGKCDGKCDGKCGDLPFCQVCESRIVNSLHYYTPQGVPYSEWMRQGEEGTNHDPEVRGYPGDPGREQAHRDAWSLWCKEERALRIHDARRDRIESRGCFAKSVHRLLVVVGSIFPSVNYVVDGRYSLPECPECAAERQKAA